MGITDHISKSEHPDQKQRKRTPPVSKRVAQKDDINASQKAAATLRYAGLRYFPVKDIKGELVKLLMDGGRHTPRYRPLLLCFKIYHMAINVNTMNATR